MTHFKRVFSLGLLALLVACGSPPSSGGRIQATTPQPLSVNQTQTTFTLQNTGSSSLNWTISVANASANPQPGNWFAVSPASGALAPGAEADVTLTLLSSLAPGDYSATLNVNYPGGPTSFDVTGTVGGGAASGFTLATDDATNSVAPGAEVRVPIAIVRESGFTGEVALEVLGAPQGLSGTFDPAQTTGSESTLVVTTNNQVAAGSYTLTVRGVSGSRSDTAEVNVSVVGTTTAPTFSLSLSPGNLTVAPGSSGAATVTLQKTASFTGNVALSASGAPSGVSVSFSPSSTGTTSEVTVRVGSGVQPGSYTLTIKGAGGGLESSTRLGLTVPSPDAGGSARISGSLRTDAYLGDFTVPSDLTGDQIRAQSLTSRPEYVPGQVLLKLEPGLAVQSGGTLELAQTLSERHGLSLLRAPQDGLLVAAVPEGESVPEAAARLSREPGVAYAEPNFYIYPLAVPNDPLYDRQWHLAVSGVPVAWDARDASTVTVAVIDTGFQTNHPDLSGVFLAGYDFCGLAEDTNGDNRLDSCTRVDADVRPDGGVGGPDTHGTHVAGIIAAQGNSQGVAGVLKGGARIVPVKIFFNFEFTTAERLAQGIRWAAGLPVTGVPNNANPAKVINLSLGTPSDSQTVRAAVTAAQNSGALLIAAAGNAGHTGQGVLYPAKYPGVMAVGSVNSSFQRSCFSNTGPEIDVLAAGGDGFACDAPRNEAVLSTIPNSSYGTRVGSSQATPLVSGVAALVWAAEPSLTAAQVAQRLKDRAYQANGLRVVRADLALGFPGPGSSVTVSASGPSSAVDTVRLRPDGSSGTFSLANLQAGSYTVTADASGASRSLTASQSVSLTAGESETLTLRLR